jgi:protein-disulfide isomerase
MNSAFSNLGPLPLPIAGFFLYATLFVGAIRVLGTKVTEYKWIRLKMLWVLVLGAVLYSIFLFVVSVTIIKALCPICLSMYATNIGMLICLWAAGAAKLREGLRGLFRIHHALSPCGCGPFSWLPGLLSLFAACAIPMLAVIFLSDVLSIGPIETVNHVDRKSPAESLMAWKESPKIAAGEAIRTARIIGNPDAPVEVEEFLDLQCPYCRMSWKGLEPVYKKFGDKIKVVIRHFPFSYGCHPEIPNGVGHPNACRASRMVLCAATIGADYQKAMDIALSLPEFEASLEEAIPPQQADDAFDKALVNAGFSLEDIKRCLADPEILKEIRADIKRGEEIKIDGTPSVYVAGRKLPELSPPLVTAAILTALSDTVK